jgi:photosystem II stability/assembly factor-like uncharacterized protein
MLTCSRLALALGLIIGAAGLSGGALARGPARRAATTSPALPVAWTPAGPTGGYVLAMAPSSASAATVYAAGAGGAFVTHDSARTWQPLDQGIQGRILRALVLAGARSGSTPVTTLIATTLDGVVFTTPSAGHAWHVAMTGLLTHTVTALAPSPAYSHDGTVFAATEDSALYRSTDAMATWTRIHPPLQGQPAITDIVPSPAYVRDRTVFVATGDGLLASRDGGTTWHRLATLEPGGLTPSSDYNSLALSPMYAVDHTLYAGGDRVSVSHDGGRTWRDLGIVGVNGTLQRLIISPMFHSDGLLAAIASLGGVSNSPGVLYLSRDRGRSWLVLSAASTPTNVYCVAFSAAFATDHTLFAGTAGGGVLASRDVGRTWAATNVGLYGHVISGLAISPAFSSDRTLYVASLGAGLFISHSGGTYWFPAGGGINDRYAVHAVALSPRFATDHQVYVGAVNAYLQSTTAGQTWDLTYADLPNQDVRVVAASPAYGHDRTIAAGGTLDDGLALHATVFITGDGGTYWDKRDMGIAGEVVRALAYSPAFDTDRTLFAGSASYQPGGTRGGLFVTHDAGGTWRALGHSTGVLDVLSLALSPRYPADPTIFAGTSRGLYISRDSGATWRHDQQGLPHGGDIAALALSPAYAADHTLFAGGTQGLYASINRGASWQPIGAALPNGDVTALALSPAFARDHTLFAGTANSVWVGLIGGRGTAPPAPTSVVNLGQP